MCESNIITNNSSNNQQQEQKSLIHYTYAHGMHFTNGAHRVGDQMQFTRIYIEIDNLLVIHVDKTIVASAFARPMTQ